jgi:lysozyme
MATVYAKRCVMVAGCLCLLIFFFLCQDNKSIDTSKRWGIDVSHHQGHIYWNKFDKTNTPSFVFMKATEGIKFKDPMFKTYAANFPLIEGVKTTGAYHFFRFNQNGREQARFFLDYINECSRLNVVAIDVENFGYNVGHEFDDKSLSNLNDMISIIKEERGEYPIIYCVESFYVRFLTGKIPSECKLWIRELDFLPVVFSKHAIQQKHYAVKHPAFKGKVDINYAKRIMKITMTDIALRSKTIKYYDTKI